MKIEKLNSQIEYIKTRILDHAFGTQNNTKYGVKFKSNVERLSSDYNGKLIGFFVTIEANRDDCEEYSPRQTYTQFRAVYLIGPRGGVKVVSMKHGLTEVKKKYQRLYY